MNRYFIILITSVLIFTDLYAECVEDKKVISVEAAFGWTNVSNSSNWLYDFEKATYFPDKKFDISLYHEGFSRYGQRDDLAGIGAKIKPLELTSFVLDLYYVPQNDFLARTRTYAEIIQNFWWHRQLVFSFGYSFYDFGDQTVSENKKEYVFVNMLTPGVEYYFPLGIFAGYKAFLVLNRNSELVHAHMGYLSYDNEKYVLATIGFSVGDEFITSYSSTGVDVRSFFGKAEIKVFCPFYFSLMYQHTITNDNDHRNELIFGARYDF